MPKNRILFLHKNSVFHVSLIGLFIPLTFYLFVNKYMELKPFSPLHSFQTSELLIPLMPWEAIGGCGASSGSTASDAQIKWIGGGVSGSIIDAEMLFFQAYNAEVAAYSPDKFDGHMRTKTTAALLSLFSHSRSMDLKIVVPFMFKEGPELGGSTGPFGDMSLDINKKWGMQGKFRTALTLSFPTGLSNIPGAMSTTTPANSDLQLGSGMFGGSAQINYTIDKAWGNISMGSSYGGGYFAMVTKEYSYDNSVTNGKLLSGKKTFAFSRDGDGGLNDNGVVSPDIVSAFTDFGIKNPPLTHGLSFSFALPLRDGLINSWQVLKLWRSRDPLDPDYFPTKEAAQRHADTTPGFINHIVACETDTTPNAAWVLIKNTKIHRKSYPGISMQYSIEKSDMVFPMLVGLNTRFEFDRGIKFSGFAAGIGFKFSVY